MLRLNWGMYCIFEEETHRLVGFEKLPVRTRIDSESPEVSVITKYHDGNFPEGSSLVNGFDIFHI